MSMQEWVESRRAAMGEPSGAEAAPAATVVILRDGEDGVEVLLGRRSSKLKFHGGAWVFPGGRIDPEDYGDAPDDVFEAARTAAVREALEEAGVEVQRDSLVHVSNWTTPEVSPKRFATWFFAGSALDGEERADGAETDAVQWFRPADALAAREAGDIELAPPQYVTLLTISSYATVDATLRALAAEPPFDFTPRFYFGDDGSAVCVYNDDIAYDDGDLVDGRGIRHRLVMTSECWDYIRDAP
jgi:8-oxo-dGTP pyrophosphatase MutT (NUDIX family)